MRMRRTFSLEVGRASGLSRYIYTYGWGSVAMNTPERDDAIRQIESRLEHRDTQDLLHIWATEARREWSEDGLRAIANILTRRLGALPPREETDEQRHARARHLLALAGAEERANRSRQAWQHTQAALDVAPDLADVHAAAGQHWDRRGDLAAAIRCYRQALRLNPSLEEARENLAGAEEDRRDLISQGYGVSAPAELWEAEIEGHEEEAPDWLYLNQAALNCPGRPGYRTRSGRGGFDPVDTYCEEGYVVGLWLRQLVTLRLRPRHLIYRVVGLMIGGWALLPLVFVALGTAPDGRNTARLIATSVYWAPGLLLIVNLVLAFMFPNREGD